MTIRVLGTVLPEGDAKASDIAVRLHGWAAVDGWLLIACALAPLGEELLWRRCIFTALAGAAATRLGDRRAILLAAMLSSLMFAARQLLGGDSPARLWARTLTGLVLCLVFWRTGSLLAAVTVHGLYNLGTIGAASIGVPGLPITLHGLPDMAAALSCIEIIWPSAAFRQLKGKVRQQRPHRRSE